MRFARPRPPTLPTTAPILSELRTQWLFTLGIPPRPARGYIFGGNRPYVVFPGNFFCDARTSRFPRSDRAWREKLLVYRRYFFGNRALYQKQCPRGRYFRTLCRFAANFERQSCLAYGAPGIRSFYFPIPRSACVTALAQGIY